MYWLALLFTLLIEELIALLIVRQKQVILFVFLINIISHPIAWNWYYHYGIFIGNPLTTLIWLEIIIAFVEGVILALLMRKFWKLGFIAGVVMNACSFVFGLIVF